MIDHSKDLLLACQQAATPSERATRALIFADWLEDQGHSFDAGTVRLAVESGMDGFDAVLSVPSGGSGRAAGELKVMRLGDQDLRFRWCPPGSFTMGSPPDGPDGNYTEGLVSVRHTRGFWIGEVPVTQAVWVALYGTPEYWSTTKDGPRLPVNGVTHTCCVIFCDNLTNRLRESGELPVGWRLSLPTEAQWEYACRAGTQTRFPWGDDEDRHGEYAWSGRNSEQRIHEVGLLRPNGWGIHDMLGNVHDWCMDAWFIKSIGGDDPVEKAEEPFIDPDYRVFRGGSFDSGELGRPAARFSRHVGRLSENLGFRLVMVHE